MIRSVVGCSMLGLMVATWPAHAEAAAGRTDAYTDALIPLAMLEVDKFPDPVKVDDRGITWNGVELAVQSARPLDAIVIDEPLGKAIVKRTLLLTLLGKIDLDPQGKPSSAGDTAQQVWCKDSVNPNASIDCYKDSDGDGKLDQHARGYVPRREPLSLNRIGAFETIDPIAYRRSKPAELPVYSIAYLVCGEAGPQIKFARRIKKTGALGGYAFGPCDNVSTPVANPPDADPVLLLDQVRIRIRTVDGARSSQMIEGMPAGLVVGSLRTDRPVSDVAHARRFSEERDQALAEFPDIYIPAPPSMARDPVRAGEVFFSTEIRHNITGTLQAAALQMKLFKGKPNELIPAGARMYGIQMRNTRESSNLDAYVVWCYPTPVNSPAGGKCIARDTMNITRVLDVRNRFTVTSLGIGSGEPAIEDPIVDRDDAGFGEPIVLDIAVEKIAKKKITVRYRIDRVSEQIKDTYHQQLERAADGNGYLMIGHGILMLEPLDDERIRISEKVPVAVGNEVEVDDAVALLRSFR